MKVLVVGAGRLAFQYGGGEVYVRNLVAGLSENGHGITYMFITYGAVERPVFSKTQSEITTEYELLVPIGWLNSGKQDVIINEISLKIREIEPDFVHAHAWKQVVCLACDRANIPAVITAHHGGIVCPAGALLNADDKICDVPANHVDCLKCCVKTVPGWKAWYPLIKAVPLGLRLKLGTVVGYLPFIPFVTPLMGMSGMICNKLDEVKNIGNYAAKIIAPSPAIREALIRNGIPNEKTIMIPHGIPLPKAEYVISHEAHQPLRLIYVGRINHVKGLHVLLDACCGLPEESYELHVVGSAATKLEQRYLAKLKQRYSSLNVTWHGQKDPDDVYQILGESDVMVHPTICLEVFGLNIAESLAMGCPVVATRCGGAENQIQDGANGLLVPPNDPLALRQAIQELIDEPELIQEMSGQTGTVRSIEQHVLDLEKVYQECIE